MSSVTLILECPNRWPPEHEWGGEVLRFGLVRFSTLSLADLLRFRVTAATLTQARKTALILVWLHGGASHLETYGPKPLASSDYRGPYAPIATKVPGIDLSQLLPRHARVADRFTLLRSVVHTGFCHQQGTQQLLTGHPERVLRNTPLHPDVFSIAHKLRYQKERRLPNYVSVSPVSYGGSAADISGRRAGDPGGAFINSCCVSKDASPLCRVDSEEVARLCRAFPRDAALWV